MSGQFGIGWSGLSVDVLCRIIGRQVEQRAEVWWWCR